MSKTDHGDSAPAEIDDFASDVLDLVDSIPPGHVMSYGDIAEYLGRYGPRRVGRVMSTHGGAVPWWRVIHADGYAGFNELFVGGRIVEAGHPEG